MRPLHPHSTRFNLLVYRSYFSTRLKSEMTNTEQLELARLCVWYVEARRSRSVDEQPAMGSAVAIRVRNTRTNEYKSLLLTCAHLVKSTAAGYGKGGLRNEVLCWRPGWGYTPYMVGGPWPESENDGIYAAKVWDVWERSVSEDWDEQQCRDVADWVLLEVIETSFQDLPHLRVAPAGGRARSITVIGYPDGSKLWKPSSVVEAVISTEFRVDRREITPGVTRLDGGEGAAAGMSGGAVLDVQADLIGLYRGQSPTHLSKVALQIQPMQQMLQEKGWELIQGTKPVTPLFKTAAIVAGCAILAVALVFALVFWPRVPDAEELTEAEEIAPELFFDPVSATAPPDADSHPIEDVHFYNAAREHTEQTLAEVPEDQELVIADYEHQGPDAELVAIAKGSYWPVGKLRATQGSASKLNAVVPAEAKLALRTTQTGVIRFKANAYLRKSTAFMRTVVHLRAWLSSPNKPGGLSWGDVPLAGCEVTAQPMFFEPKNIVPVLLDAKGKSKLVIEHAADLNKMKVFFQVTKVSDQFAQFQPLLPMQLGVVSVGDAVVYPFPEPAELVVGKDQERELQVIPYSDFPELNRSLLVKSLSGPANAAGSSDGTSDGGAASASEKVDTLASDAGIQSQSVKTALDSWAERLGRERPVIEVAKILADGFDRHQISDGDLLHDLAGKVGPAVCLVRPKNRSANSPIYGVGFLIAKNTVVCFYVGDVGEGIEVSFANRPLDDNAEFKPVSNVLYQKGNYALLDVPDSPDVALKMDMNGPGGEAPKVVVFGYPVRDARLPDELQQMMGEIDHPSKSLMPGGITPVPEGVTSAEGFDYIGHDATTSGGTGGGPIIDMKTGLVLGIHCGGRWTNSVKANFGVPMDQFLAKDVRTLLESRGVRFQDRVFTIRAPEESVQGYDSEFLTGLELPLPEVSDDFFKTSDRLDYQHFSVVMNLNRGVMAYAAANVDRSSLQATGAAQPFHFDSRLPAFQQLGTEFYTGNELDAWHIVAPSWVAWGTAAEAAVASENAYSFTNVAPQYNWFHQQGWSRLQQYVLSEMNPSAQRVSLFAGPISTADDPEYRNRRIPQAYWLVAVTHDPADAAKPKCDAWIIPQLKMFNAVPVQQSFTADVLQSFRVKLGDVEKQSRLKFADVLHGP